MNFYFLFKALHIISMIAWMAGIPERVGYAAGFRKKFLTHSYSSPEGKIHKTDYFLKLLSQWGVPADGRSPDFFPSEGAEAELWQLLQKEGISQETPYAVLHVGGNWNLKRWPLEYFIRWIGLHLKKEPVCKIILCGTAKEEHLSKKIKESFPGGEVVSLSGKTSLSILA